MMLGARKARIYRAWYNMRQRCNNPDRRDFAWYGARGISVCPEWENSFHAFMAWALANGYEDHLTLDRIETDGPYCPENCRWATHKDQANNRRTTRYITMGNRTQSIKQWAEEIGMDNTTLWRRLAAGWSVERALTEPVQTRKRRLSS